MTDLTQTASVKVYIQYEAGSTNEERSYLYLCD